MDFLAIVYLTLLICGFVSVVILIGIAVSALWLRYIDRHLRACPRCRRKAAGYIVETETASSHSHVDSKGREPARVTEEHLIDHYQCEHCGHTWTRSFKQTKRTRPN